MTRKLPAKLNVVLILGSAPDALKAQDWDLSLFQSRVAINNAWQISDTWDYLIYPEDFPADRLPSEPFQGHAQKRLIDASSYVPHQNRYGGFVYAGGTMAFTAGYWALGALKPDVLAFLGCDMVYAPSAAGGSHFYGWGTPDPLRADVTLQSLEAKSARLLAFAHAQQCAVVNLSDQPASRLVFPRMAIDELAQVSIARDTLIKQAPMLDAAGVENALRTETAAGLMVASGRYWEVEDELDKDKLKEIDALWLGAAGH